jgi:hypothetical protein
MWQTKFHTHAKQRVIFFLIFIFSYSKLEDEGSEPNDNKRFLT